MLGEIARFASGRRTKWVLVGIWVVLAVLATVPGSLTDVTEDRIANWLPDDAAATVADKVIEERFPGGQTTSSVAVYHRDGGLTGADQQAIAAEAQRMAEVEHVLPPAVPFSPDAPDGLVSADGATAVTVIPINATSLQDIGVVTEEVRDIAGGGGGLTAQVTGPGALETDLRHAVQDADAKLLIATALLVLVLLLAIYRSVVLAVLPLSMVGMAFTITTGIITLLARAGLEVDPTTSLLVVLMFGAGTDYSLLLAARYSESCTRTRTTTRRSRGRCRARAGDPRERRDGHLRDDRAAGRAARDERHARQGDGSRDRHRAAGQRHAAAGAARDRRAPRVLAERAARAESRSGRRALAVGAARPRGHAPPRARSPPSRRVRGRRAGPAHL